MASIKLEYIVDGTDFVSCGRASEDVKKVLRGIGIPGDIIRKIVIAMYEGEINMVIHANGGVATVEIDGDSVAIDLVDTGKGIEDVAMAMREGFSTATNEIRELGFGAGMGLPNMKKNSDEMEIDSTPGKGTHIKMRFNLN